MYGGSRRKEATLTTAALAVSPDCRFYIPAPESHRSVAALASFRKVVARSYPNRTAIQFSKVTRETSPHRFGKESGFAPPVRKKFFHLFRLGRVKTNPPCGKIFQKVLSLIWTKGIEMDTHFCGREKSPSTCSDRGRSIFNRFLKKLFFGQMMRFPHRFYGCEKKSSHLFRLGEPIFQPSLRKNFASH